MSDYNSSLPVRTENNGDVAARIVDRTITSQALAVGADGSINITDNGGSITVDGTVELGATTLAALESITVQNGAGAAAVNIQDGGNSITVDGTVELGATSLAALESITVQNPAGASAVNIQDGGNSITVDGTVTVSNLPTTVDTNYGVVGANTIRAASQIGNATGAANFGAGATGAQTLRVEANQGASGIAANGWFTRVTDGTDTLQVNTDGSLNVNVSGNPAGTEINNYNVALALAAAASSNHDYTVTVATTFYLSQVEAAASGKMKIEVQVETGVATGIFTTRFVQFNSTAQTNMSIRLASPVNVAAGVRVRVIRTNRDNQSQDVYSTISGQEI